MPLGKTFDEICKVSAMKATMALAKFLKKPLGVDIQPIKIEQAKNIKLLMPSKEMAVSLFVPIKGNISGSAFLIFSESSASALGNVLLQKKTSDDLEKSALIEVANIVIGNFLTPFAQSLQMSSLIHRPAVFEKAPFKIIYEHIQTVLSQESDQKNLVNIPFGYKDGAISGWVLIIFEAETMQNKFNNLFTVS